MALLFCVLLVALFQSQIYRLEKYNQSLQSDLSRLEPKYTELARIKNEIINSRLSSNTTNKVLDLLYDIASQKPTDILFKVINYSRNNRISLQGYAAKSESPVEFVRALEKQTKYEEVKIKYISDKSTNRNQLVEFQIEIKIKND